MTVGGLCVAFLCCCTIQVLGLSLPATAYLPENNSTIPSIPSNPTNLTAPHPSVGFVVKYTDWRHVIFKPTQMCINAIELMYYFTELPWAGKIDAAVTMSGPRFTSEINIDVGIRNTPGPIPIEYAVQALYEMGIRMAQEKRYFLQWGRIFVKGTQRGIIRFQQSTEQSDSDYQIRGTEPLQIANSNDTSTFEVGTLSGPARNGAVDGEDDLNEGKIFDPENRQLVINYKFDRSSMAGREVFTSFLQALATATEHHQDEVGASINTYSASLETSLSIHHLDSPRYYRRGMTWRVLSRTLILIWEQLVMGNIPGRRRPPPRYEGLEFEIFREGEKVGHGELWSVNKPRFGISVSK